MRYVNADAADKFAGFNLKFGKLPRGGGPLAGPYRPVLTARVPRRDFLGRGPAFLAVTGYYLPYRATICRPSYSLPTNNSEMRDNQELRQPST